MNENEDIVLVKRCLQGEHGAFEALVRKYQKTLFNVLYQIVRDYSDAEDLTQTVLVKVYENLKKYNDKYKFYSWIYRIAINEGLNFVQQKKAVYEIPEEYESTEKSPDRVLNEAEVVEQIDQALAALDPNYRVLIVMRHFLDFSYKEISEVVKLPEKTVKSRIYMARQNMARHMLAKGIDVDEQS